MPPNKKPYEPSARVRSMKIGVGRFTARALWLVWLILAAAILTTTVDYVRPGQIAVIKNNLTGGETLKRTDGVVVHAPLGITRVYILDKTQQTVRMTATKGAGERRGLDNVRVKTSDGTNVFVDVELVYSLSPDLAQTVVRALGEDHRHADAVLLRPAAQDSPEGDAEDRHRRDRSQADDQAGGKDALAHA